MIVSRNSMISMSSIRILKLTLVMPSSLSSKTTHSIPESIGIVIGTPEGNIVYTGDFKFDQTASESYATDFARLAEIGREGVLALLSDSANADSNIQVASEQEVGDAILDTIADWDGRVIVAAVAATFLGFSRSLMLRLRLAVEWS